MGHTATATRPEASPLAGADITRRVNAERLALLGWGRAILLQLAHPLIAAGVYEHSAFRAGARVAASRLHATVHAMLALTFGTGAERDAALQAIRTIHQRVHGHLPAAVGPFPAGARYSAEDPALVEWVHVTLLESVPLVYDLFVAPLSEAERDAYCDEAAWVAIALGARPAEVPRSWAEARARLEHGYGSGVIVVGPQAHELSRSIIAPGLGRLMPPAGWLNRLVTIGLLPPHIREQYGLRWSAREQRTLDRVVPALRAVRRVLPERLALWPHARQ
jgi:uncharacterized protein (DUF2236 family)